MMSTAKLYDRLNERERVSALLLALVRGDDLETQRLNLSAPRRTEWRSHHLGRATAIWAVAAIVRIDVLGTLADLWHSQTRLAWATEHAEEAEAANQSTNDPNRDVRLWRAFADVATWKLSQLQAAWLIVAERLGIPPEFLDTFGECIALRLTNERLAENTPTADTVRERLAELTSETVELATADSIAAGWLAMFHELN